MKRLLLSILFFISCSDSTTEPKDCLGVSGGNAILDECGVCDSNSSNDCENNGTIGIGLYGLELIEFLQDYFSLIVFVNFLQVHIQ